jgi:hypothetical protein
MANFTISGGRLCGGSLLGGGGFGVEQGCLGSSRRKLWRRPVKERSAGKQVKIAMKERETRKCRGGRWGKEEVVDREMGNHVRRTGR